MCGGAVPSKSEIDYRAEDDHRTLERAAEITADAARMDGVKRHHAKKTAATKRMDQLLGGKRAAKGAKRSMPKRSMPAR